MTRSKKALPLYYLSLLAQTAAILLKMNDIALETATYYSCIVNLKDLHIRIRMYI